MDAVDAFCRLVLGGPGAVGIAHLPAEPGTDRHATLAAAWAACEDELARRRGSLIWDEAPVAEEGALVDRLARVPERERAALAAQAVGLDEEAVEQMLGVERGEGERLLARGHATLAGLGRPADEVCAATRAMLAVGRRDAGAHCAECAEFGRAVAEQRPVLRRAAGVVVPARRASGGEHVRRLLEPSGSRGRLAVGLVVLLLAGLAGFGVVRTVATPDGSAGGSAGGDGVVTATPVGPLPPGVDPQP